MKYLNGLAWVIAIITVAAVAAYWSDIKFLYKHRDTIKLAADVSDGLQQMGIGK